MESDCVSLIDKGCKVTVKTGSALIKAGGSLVQSSAKQGANFMVNRTADIYDRHESLSDGVGKGSVGNATMIVRSGYRVLRAGGRSTINFRKRNLAKERYIKDHYIAENGLDAWNNLTNYEKMNILQQKEAWKRKTRKEKWEVYNSQGIRQGLGITSMKSSLARSSKEMLSNQTRKGFAMLSNREDISSKTIGTTLRGSRLAWKNRQRIQETSVKFVAMIKSMITGMISFIASIPAMISAIMASVPALLVVAFLILVACFFGVDLEFTGRVSLLSEEEIKLENEYRMSINPEEVLAITSVLGWSTPDFADYEMLMSLALDGKRGNQVSFETMMDNVFNKYNPAVRLNPNSPIDKNENTGWNYWTSEIWKNQIMKFSIYKGSWIKLYPTYENASIAEKQQMGTSAYIEDMKARCRKALEINGYNYLAAFLTIDNPPEVFNNYILPQDSGARVSSPTGYRSIEINGSTDDSFHYGTDIAVAGGTPVYAPADMQVVYADGSQTAEGTATGLWGAGNVVVLKKAMFDRKGKECYLYVALCHMQHNSISVRAGQNIRGGTQVGRVGTTGTSTGNHLHLQTWISVNNYTKSNLKWVDVSPARLSDTEVGKTYSVTDHDYEAIYIEGLLFYDIEYRNRLFR